MREGGRLGGNYARVVELINRKEVERWRWSGPWLKSWAEKSGGSRGLANHAIRGWDGTTNADHDEDEGEHNDTHGMGCDEQEMMAMGKRSHETEGGLDIGWRLRLSVVLVEQSRSPLRTGSVRRVGRDGLGSWDLGLGTQVLTLRADAGNCSSAGGGWRSVAAVGPVSRASERDTPTHDAARDRMMAAAAGAE